jgi:hypothetical protein
MFGMRKSLTMSAMVGMSLFLTQGVSASDEYPSRVYWGDTHLHSSFSADANVIGNVSLTPIDAYAFAKGQKVEVTPGVDTQLSRPLDFLVVSDHSEYLGALAVNRGRNLLEKVSGLSHRFFGAIMQLADITESPDDETALIRKDTWKKSIEMAEQANEPGIFSAITGFEWTSMPGGDNLHRVVLFRDGEARTSQVIPYSILESHDPRDLWRYMDNYEQTTGGKALAIPHNGNVSNGRMFALTQYDGSAIDNAYASARARWEPVVEVTQIKGDSETHPWLSPDDEFADYGTWDKGNLGGNAQKTPNMLAYEYARSALKLGLQIDQQVGANPFKFGMIGSTDAHTSLATADDNNFWGKAANYHPGSEKRTSGPFMIVRAPRADSQPIDWSDQTVGPNDTVIQSWEQVASGYAAVWATENTREAIFDAMQRKEVYATTGPRMSVRFFAGWNLDPDKVEQADGIAYLYEQGVPMGGELQAKGDERPMFYAAVQKDPAGANLDRVQVVKGWLDANGQLHEKVFDVVWGGDRQIVNGRLEPVQSTVNLQSASYANTVGAEYLSTLWSDPEYQASERAFYYVRVLEIPTPRWTAYDEATLGADHPEEAQRVHQERAYTSPIWVNP